MTCEPVIFDDLFGWDRAILKSDMSGTRVEVPQGAIARGDTYKIQVLVHLNVEQFASSIGRNARNAVVNTDDTDDLDPDLCIHPAIQTSMSEVQYFVSPVCEVRMLQALTPRCRNTLQEKGLNKHIKILVPHCLSRVGQKEHVSVYSLNAADLLLQENEGPSRETSTTSRGRSTDSTDSITKRAQFDLGEDMEMSSSTQVIRYITDAIFNMLGMLEISTLLNYLIHHDLCWWDISHFCLYSLCKRKKIHGLFKKSGVKISHMANPMGT